MATGTPVRLRAALGTIANRLGNVTVNRWYVIQRNALDFEEKRDGAWRNYVDTSLTDIWSVVSGSCTTPYRGEVIAEPSPYAWWAMDDQPLSGGVQPSSLRNAAPGNTNVLNITPASGGVTAGDSYSTTGTDLSTTYGTSGGAAAVGGHVAGRPAAGLDVRRPAVLPGVLRDV